MQRTIAFLHEQAEDGLLPWAVQQAAAEKFSLSLGEIEQIILEQGLLPARYQRNQQIISNRQQLQLFRSSVAVIGCGGLGGYVIEELARLGVGQIVAIDPDVFEEHNLNRQRFSSIRGLGEPKVKKAAEGVMEINPAVILQPVQSAFSKENGCALLVGVNVVIDALDNIPTRLELAKICNKMNIPLVHGAIAGWYGQVCTIFPGEDSMQQIYRHWVEGKGEEQELGNPSFTPAVVASLEVAETCKILLDQGELLRGRQLYINLLEMEIEEIPL